MGTSNITCPNCKGQIPLTIIAHKSQAQQGPGQIFEQSVSTLHEASNPTVIDNPKSFWQSDGVSYSLAGAFAGGVVFVFGWLYSIDMGPVVAGAALAAGLGLHILKIWLHRPARATVASKPQTTKIQIEHVSDDKSHWLLDELQLDISQQQLSQVAGAIVQNNFQWAMSINTGPGRLSQSKHHKLKDKFLELQYIQPLPNGANGYTVTGRGRRVLQSLALFPT